MPNMPWKDFDSFESNFSVLILKKNSFALMMSKIQTFKDVKINI